MAETVALAVIENLVHMSRQDFPSGYVCIAATLPDGINIALEKNLRERAYLRDLSSRLSATDGLKPASQPCSKWRP
jgi:hypothetical protein